MASTITTISGSSLVDLGSSAGDMAGGCEDADTRGPPHAQRALTLTAFWMLLATSTTVMS